MRGTKLLALWIAGCAATVGSAQINVAPGTILDGPTGDGIWHWIEVEPVRNSASGWLTVTGIADVKISGSKFHADLKPDTAQGFDAIALDGNIVGNRLRVTEVLLNTDASPMTIDGTIRRTLFGNDIREEVIVFRGGQAGDVSYLGLTRSTRKGS